MKFSILGCGWLGQPLALALIKENHQVKGSTTSFDKIQQFTNVGIKPYLIEIINNSIQGEINAFLDSEILIISVPFSRQKDNFSAYNKLCLLIGKTPIKKVIFISSTSVYANTNGIVFEDKNNFVNPKKQGLVDLENLFLNSPYFETTVIRFSGLLGGVRHPGNFFSSDRTVKDGQAPVNLIYREDCIKIILELVRKNIWNQVFNATADTHPSKKVFYTAASLAIGNKPPGFLEDKDLGYKIVSNEKLKKALGYSFIHGDLIEGLKSFN